MTTESALALLQLTSQPCGHGAQEGGPGLWARQAASGSASPCLKGSYRN